MQLNNEAYENMNSKFSFNQFYLGNRLDKGLDIEDYRIYNNEERGTKNLDFVVIMQ